MTKTVFWISILVTVFLILQTIAIFNLAAQETGLQEENTENEFGVENEGQNSKKPLNQGKYQAKRTAQTINEKSRLNPDNEVLDLYDSITTLTITSQISDYLDQEKAFHWMFKIYGYSEYIPDNENSQEGDLLRIDELFLDWAHSKWFASIGKRRNTWGTTSIWNPVNVLVPSKNPLTTEPQSEGHPSLLINYASEPISFDLVFTRDYDRDWESKHDRWGGRFGLLFDDIELGFYYFDGEPYDEDEIEGTLSTTEYGSLIGISYSSNLFDDATLYVEVASFSENTRFYFDKEGNSITKDERTYKSVLGSVITLDGNASILLEIYHNSEGYTAEERKNYFAKLDSTLSNVKQSNILSDSQKEGLQNAILYHFQTWSMNQNYFLFTYSKSFLEKYNMSLNFIVADDESFITTLNGSYEISDYYLMEASLRCFTGEKESEFGNVTYSSTASLALSSSF